MSRVLLTGASGFVGRAVYERLLVLADFELVVAARKSLENLHSETLFIQITDIGGMTEWADAIKGASVVIHCAGRAHAPSRGDDSLAAFRKVNVDGTLRLARQAIEAGVKRFIYISSIKVNGEGMALGCPYTADDVPAPVDPYGVSKMEAERGLQLLAAETGMEVVIIRPVLVYGAGVNANFRSMMNWLSRGVPLPLGATANKRSLVALDNLVDLIVTCIDHPAAANQTFLVSDDEDLSTTQLLRRMASALGKPARLLPVPSWLLALGAAMLGKRALYQRLCGSLQVDISTTRELLNWAPPVSVDVALRKTAEHFLQQRM